MHYFSDVLCEANAKFNERRLINSNYRSSFEKTNVHCGAEEARRQASDVTMGFMPRPRRHSAQSADSREWGFTEQIKIQLPFRFANGRVEINFTGFTEFAELSSDSLHFVSLVSSLRCFNFHLSFSVHCVSFLFLAVFVLGLFRL